MTQMNESQPTPHDTTVHVIEQNIARLKALQQRSASFPPLDQEEIADYLHECIGMETNASEISTMITTLEQRVAQYREKKEQ